MDSPARVDTIVTTLADAIRAPAVPMDDGSVEDAVEEVADTVIGPP